MAEVNAKHALDDVTGADAGVELRDPKRQRTDEMKAEQGASQSLISDEQKFWTAVAEPPDINYWKILEWDYETLKDLLTDQMAYTGAVKYVKYEQIDLELECSLLDEYTEWIEVRQKTVSASGNEQQNKFLETLRHDLEEDKGVVGEELKTIDARLRIWSLSQSYQMMEKIQDELRARLAKDNKGVVEGSRTREGAVVSLHAGADELEEMENSELGQRFKRLCEALGTSASSTAKPAIFPSSVEVGDGLMRGDHSESESSQYATADEASPSR